MKCKESTVEAQKLSGFITDAYFFYLKKCTQGVRYNSQTPYAYFGKHSHLTKIW